jgi:trans-AT polyketide synthase, acyltransferase and oxidoreductase domains
LDLLKSRLPSGSPYGANLLANYDNPRLERETVDLYLRDGIQNIEAAAFVQVTPALALFRASGLSRGPDDSVRCSHRVLAKVSRLEVAEAFMKPLDDHLLQGLLAQGDITPEQAALARSVPVSHDICVEADSGGHTDGDIPTILFPTMIRLRDQIASQYRYNDPLLVGLAGGIGTPEAAAAAFLLGADFILTGSINQCTIEAGTSDAVKDLLQEIGIHDTDYAPAGDLFESGSKVQVLKRGVFFPTRANKLFALYNQFDSLDELPEKTRRLLENTYFRRSLEDIWQEVARHYKEDGRDQLLSEIAKHPKRRMAAVFKWYFAYSTQLAFSGNASDRVNFQVHTGPALGAFNRWMRGTPLQDWRARHVDEIGLKLMDASLAFLNGQINRLSAASVATPPFDERGAAE